MGDLKIESGIVTLYYNNSNVAGGTFTYKNTYTKVPCVIPSMSAMGNNGTYLSWQVKIGSVGLDSCAIFVQTEHNNIPSGAIIKLQCVVIGS